jgi:hypothetical protein
MQTLIDFSETFEALGDAVSPYILGWLSNQLDLHSALLMTPCDMTLVGLLGFICGSLGVQDMSQAEV